MMKEKLWYPVAKIESIDTTTNKTIVNVEVDTKASASFYGYLNIIGWLKSFTKNKLSCMLQGYMLNIFLSKDTLDEIIKGIKETNSYKTNTFPFNNCTSHKDFQKLVKSLEDISLNYKNPDDEIVLLII